jgi:hypothetical protein
MYKTTDIVLAATLKLNGYDIIEIQKNGQKGTFIFDEVPEAFVKSYDLGQVLVNPTQFNQAVKSLTLACKR